jgi:hypothetical protein
LHNLKESVANCALYFFEKRRKKMKRLVITTFLGLALVLGFGFGFFPATEQRAACADCDAGNVNTVREIFKAFDDECAKKLNKTTVQKAECFVLGIYNDVLSKMKVFSKDNRFGPGDRILFVGESQNGNLVGGINRSFQTGIPLNKDSLKVEVNKTDGGNGAIIKICTIDEAGNLVRVGTINFPEDNTTGTKSVTVNGVKGKVVRINIESFGGLVKTFKYTLKTS